MHEIRSAYDEWVLKSTVCSNFSCFVLYNNVEVVIMHLKLEKLQPTQAVFSPLFHNSVKPPRNQKKPKYSVSKR